MRKNFRNVNSTALSDYNEFIASIEDYCPGLFNNKHSFFELDLDNSIDENRNDNSQETSKRFRMILRVIFVKILKFQNEKLSKSSAEKSTDRINLEHFFQALLNNELQLDTF